LIVIALDQSIRRPTEGQNTHTHTHTQAHTHYTKQKKKTSLKIKPCGKSCCLDQRPPVSNWRWKLHCPPKHRYLLTSRHSRQPEHPVIPLRELEISQKHISLEADSEVGFWLPLGQKLMRNLFLNRKRHGEEWWCKRQTISVRLGTTLGLEFVTCYLFEGSTRLSKQSAGYQQWVPTARMFKPHCYTSITWQAKLSRFQNFTCKSPYVGVRFKLRNVLRSCHMLPHNYTVRFKRFRSFRRSVTVRRILELI